MVVFFPPLLKFFCKLSPIFENHYYPGLDADSDQWQEGDDMQVSVLSGQRPSSKLREGQMWAGGPGVREIDDGLP